MCCLQEGKNLATTLYMQVPEFASLNVVCVGECCLWREYVSVMCKVV